MFGLKERTRRGLTEALGIPLVLGSLTLVCLVLHRWVEAGL